ncbi:MAG: SAM-dependent methyltransferase [Desulfurivibrionaceae bacterium]|nr:SAM-dependent methyltransferase [Desulfurivibrionaceae bacterium]
MSEKDRKQNKTGKVYLVGAGPGDPDLITVKGLNVLRRAEVLVYDHLASKHLLKHVPDSVKKIYAGKKGNVHHAFSQDEINRIPLQCRVSAKLNDGIG